MNKMCPSTGNVSVTCEEQNKKKGDCCALACSFFNCTDTTGAINTGKERMCVVQKTCLLI